MKEHFKKIGYGFIIGFVFLSIIIMNNGNMVFGELLFYEIIPYYSFNENMSAVFDFKSTKKVDDKLVNSDKNNNKSKSKEDSKNTQEAVEVIGINDVDYQPEPDNSNIQNHFVKDNLKFDLEKLKDLSYLRQNFYIVDKKTGMTSDYFNAEKFLNADLSITKQGDMPKILVFHTHSREMFADSNTSDINEGIVGAGNRLCSVLENKYGIKTIHHTGSYDVVDGKTQIMGAYERMEPAIRKILADNPSIEVVIDLHRDGVNENVKLVKNINGKPTAQIMFFNGLCRINQNGKLNDISNLKNPYVDTNLALSFNMQLVANSLYPGFTRKVYLNAYRYSLHMSPKSMLIEAGAQTNTKEEIYNAMDILAEILNDVLCGNTSNTDTSAN